MRWKVHVANDLGVLDESNRLVCIARTPQEAALMAAAPNMLASLRLVLFAATKDADGNDGIIDRKAVTEIVRLSIATATGEEGA